MAVSLFNTILLLWLGLTVLLNAERRNWGVWLTGAALLLGGGFFVSHTAILGYGLTSTSWEMNLWWWAGWGPVLLLPLAWYVITLWYAGFWPDRPGSALRRRQGPWLIVTLVLAVVLVGLLIFANPLPSYTQVVQLDLAATPELGGIPLLILVYPFYIVLCIALSLDALRRPEPSKRMMGDIARRRARPWLMATAFVLLLVSLLTGWIILWIVLNARQASWLPRTSSMSLTVAWFDLVIALLIALAVILQGRAIVSYEVFTGHVLPRRGMYRHWRSAVILAGGYSLVVGGSLAFRLHSIYSLLLTTILMVAFYALFSWRSFAERERHLELLRPFVTSQRLYEHLLATSAATPVEVDAASPFRALCAEVLGTRVAYLVALGPLAPLVGPALAYPEGTAAPAAAPFDLAGRREEAGAALSPQVMCLPVDPVRFGGAVWAVPLWSERGLIGVLLLGDKRDGGLYTVEEIEIARASSERLIDTQASAELARRLMALQRWRLAQTQVVDRQARRVLHDDILPNLHTAMLALARDAPGSGQATGEAVTLLTQVHRQISDLLRQMPVPVAPEIGRRGLTGALAEVVTQELAGAFDQVAWQIEPSAAGRAEALPSLAAEVLFYAAREALRNAARHGRSPDNSRPFHLKLEVTAHDGLEIIIEDNGVGLAAVPGPSNGSGQGLALHSTMLAVIGGTLEVESVPDSFTRVALKLPTSAW
jgi:signal transduction histidine kinase